MPVCDKTRLRPDVAQFFFVDMVNEHNIYDKQYLLRRFWQIPTVMKLIKKLTEVNAKCYTERIRDVKIIKSFFTVKEMEFLSKINRGINDYFASKFEQRYPLPATVKIENATINKVPCEWYIPNNAPKDKVLIYFHGGGYIVGSVHQARRFLTQFATRINMKILSVEYRLTPKFKFPTQLEDSLGVYQGILNLGYDPKQIFMGGESAGGHLTLISLIKIKMDTLPMLGGAIILSPVTDLTFTHPNYFDNWPTDPVLGDICLPAYIAAGLQDPVPNLTNPLYSPVLGDLTGLPPLLIIAAKPEIFYLDSVRFAEKAKAAGVEVKLKSYDEMVHAFPCFIGEQAKWPEIEDALREINAFVKKAGH